MTDRNDRPKRIAYCKRLSSRGRINTSVPNPITPAPKMNPANRRLCRWRDSIALTKSFIEACKSNNTSIVLDTLNVWHERLPEFDYEAIGAKYKAVKHETMTEEESNVWERIQSLIQRFQNADRIVIGTPMWRMDFGRPRSSAYSNRSEKSATTCGVSG
jgi:hypothetical protein